MISYNCIDDKTCTYSVHAYTCIHVYNILCLFLSAEYSLLENWYPSFVEHLDDKMDDLMTSKKQSVTIKDEKKIQYQLSNLIQHFVLDIMLLFEQQDLTLQVKVLSVRKRRDLKKNSTYLKKRKKKKHTHTHILTLLVLPGGMQSLLVSPSSGECQT